MEKREDCWWRESTLGEDVDVKVGTYLRANHQEYQEIRHQIDELIQQYPAVRALFESEDAVTLTAEEHKALIRYFCLESSVEMIEREYHFYMGQSMMYSYGTMLTSIRNSVLGENVEPAGYLTDHLLDLIAESRTDELEDEFQEKSQKYRDAIQEVHTATFRGQQGRISRTVWAILNGQPSRSAERTFVHSANQYSL